jgi:hypothetical protein
LAARNLIHLGLDARAFFECIQLSRRLIGKYNYHFSPEFNSSARQTQNKSAAKLIAQNAHASKMILTTIEDDKFFLKMVSAVYKDP